MNKDQNRTRRLFLVRHGEAADNIEMRYLGTRDEPLTEKGMQQARQVAEALSPLSIGRIISSPLQRAADTAARIQEACGIELRLDPRLAEGSFGSWEGLTRAEVLKLGNSELLARWESDPFTAPPGGESIDSVQKRIVSLAEELGSEPQDSSVVLVSHVGPIKALLAAVLDIPIMASRRLFIDPGTISVVEWGAHPFLRLFNSHAHLGWSSARWM